MKRIINDIYTIFYKLFKLSFFSIILTTAVVSMLNYFIAYGLVLIFEGLVPMLKSLEILFKSKIQIVTFLAIFFSVGYFSLKASKSNTATRKIDLMLILFYILISVVLIFYIKFIKLLNT